MSRCGLDVIREAAALALLVELLMEVQALEAEFTRSRDQARGLERAELLDRLAQAGDLVQRIQIVAGGGSVRDLDAPTLLEVTDHSLQIVELKQAIEDLEDSA